MMGYKVLDADMSSRLDNMQYELGKWYEVEGCLELYKNGLHFCDTLEETLFHAIKTSRFFKIETDGEVRKADRTTDNICVARKIRLVEEIQITAENLDEFVRSDDWRIRHLMARNGRPQDLDILVHDLDWKVRAEVAYHCRPQDLDILVRDKSHFVRLRVARQGRPQDLDILVRDEHPDVRYEVARKKRPQDLDILVQDEDPNVREGVARYGRPQDLDVLIHDKEGFVRFEVACKGNPEHLKILENDEDIWVRKAVSDRKRFARIDRVFKFDDFLSKICGFFSFKN